MKGILIEMNDNFVNAVNKEIEDEQKFTLTENYGKQFATTNSSLLDLFATIGATREKSEDDIISAFSKAFDEDPLLATRMAFYARDIRDGGLGERRVFRIILKWLAQTNPDIVEKNLWAIPEFGRWDDMFVLRGTPLENSMLDFIAKQLSQDIINESKGGDNISLLGKWMPSVNTSSKETVELAKWLIKKFHMKEKNYRKMLSRLRAKIDILEAKMSAKKWQEINYENVPALAMNRHIKAFILNDSERFREYIDNVKNGSASIKASTLYPYDILRQGNWVIGRGMTGWNQALEEQWKALPNYVEGENNILVMADTSGSMVGLPMQISVGLAVYFAERNHGAFKDLYMTFSKRPTFVKIKGDTLKEHLSNVPNIVANTDIAKAFDKILEVAVTNNLKQEDLPTHLVIITDMEFDQCGDNDRFYKYASKKFANAGYQLPLVVFWNVSQRTWGFQTRANKEGVIMISGASAGSFKQLIQNISKTPLDFMYEVLNKEPYNKIVI